MKIEYSTDYALIKAILSHPENWYYVSDDFCESIEQFEPRQGNGFHYYLVIEDEKPVGCLMLVQVSTVALELHAALTPNFKGDKSQSVLDGLLPVIRADLPAAKRLRVFIPAWNKRALSAAIKSGLEFMGIEKEGSAKDGALHDLILFGVRI